MRTSEYGTAQERTEFWGLAATFPKCGPLVKSGTLPPLANSLKLNESNELLRMPHDRLWFPASRATRHLQLEHP